MKHLNIFSISLLALIFVACSGSGTYRGNWKGMTANGEKIDINFEANTFSVKDSTGESKKFEYTQNSVNIENGVETYGIHLKDGRSYQINFPVANDESVGLINDGNGNPMFTISRKDYIRYEDIFKLK